MLDPEVIIVLGCYGVPSGTPVGKGGVRDRAGWHEES